MTGSTAPIRPLPDEVAAQIKSSVDITTLDKIVIALFKNALDSSSRKIEVSVDFGRGNCSVEDDGLGIPPGEFLENGGLGKSYHTSKHSELKNVHGQQGTFLASLAAISASRLVPAPPYHHLANREHGTKVDVHDLFGNMPVRIKQRSLDAAASKDYGREWDRLVKDIVGLLLAWPCPVNTTIVDRKADRRIVFKHKAAIPPQPTMRPDPSALEVRDPEWIWSLLVQGGLADPGGRDAWIKTSARTVFLTMRGYFSLRPSPTKRSQFINLGVRHLSASSGASVLYEEINHIFSLSSFGDADESHDDESTRIRKSQDNRYKKDGPTNRQLRGGGKGVDRWPMYVVQIELLEDKSEAWQGRDVLERESTLLSITKVLRAMATRFLSDHHFRPRPQRKRRRPPSKQDSPSPAAGLSPSTVVRETSTGPHRSVTSESNKQTIPTTRDDILSRHVHLPKSNVDRGRLVGDAFSHWSRIKSGNARGIEDGFLVDTNKSYKKQKGVGDREITGVSPTTPRSMSNDEPPDTRDTQRRLQTMSVEKKCEELCSDGNVEDIISWTDPVTMADVLINARTGQMVANPSKRPSSAASNIMRASTPVVPKAGSWVEIFLKEWSNPVFTPVVEQNIPKLSFDGPSIETPSRSHGRCSHVDIEKAFTEASFSTPAKLSKAALKNAKIISQLEKKFILVLLNPSPSDFDSQPILTLIDQHAADERIRIENLLTDLCTAPSTITLQLTASYAHKPTIATSLLPKPLKFVIQPQEHSLFATHAQHFAHWGILYDLHPPSSHTSESTTHLSVKFLPPVIAERCRLEPKLLIDILRTEVWKVHEHPPPPPLSSSTTTTSSNKNNNDQQTNNIFTHLTTLPQGILEMLNSRACRSAIMFNDHLEKKELRAWEG
ncbi:MAG: hypothetical protein Q9220_004056 [cf. Caloplaca sp. 1 TL-2023]